MKKIFVLIFNIIFMFVLFSCNENVENNNEENVYEVFMTNINDISSDLASKIYNKYDNTNFSISPISIINILAMILESGTTEIQNDIASYFELSSDELKDCFYTFFESIEEDYYSNEIKYDENNDAYREKNGEISIDNSFWYDKSLTINDNIGSKLMNNYDLSIHKVDFKNESSLLSDLINTYIKNKTNNLIDLNVNFDSLTDYTLINSLYYEDVWSDKDLEFTDSFYKFTNSDKSVKEIKLLESKNMLGIVQEFEKFDHFYINTLNGNKIKFLIPNDGYSVNDIFNKENISYINNISEYNGYEKDNDIYHYTKVLFPEFSTSFNSSILSILNEYFNGLFSNKNLISRFLLIDDSHASDLVHATKLEVNQSGIVGAAVSVITNYVGVDNLKKVMHEYVIDRSFGFIITNEDDVQLFAGVLNFV